MAGKNINLNVTGRTGVNEYKKEAYGIKTYTSTLSTQYCLKCVKLPLENSVFIWINMESCPDSDSFLNKPDYKKLLLDEICIDLIPW